MNDSEFCGEEMTDDEFKKQIEAVQKQAAFFVAHSNINGAPLAVIASPGAKILKESRDTSINLEEFIGILTELKDKCKKTHVENICSDVLHVHGSPGCYIKTASGGWKCICPG